MAKKKRTRRAHHRRRSNPHRRHFALARRNPISDAIPFTTAEAAAMVGGTLAGGITTTVLPGKLAPSLSGITEYAADLAIALLGAFALKRFAGAPNFAKGWFLGGVLVTAENIISDFTSKQVVTFSNPLGSGMSSFYKEGAGFPLPRDPGFYFPKPVAALTVSPAARASKSASLGWAAQYDRGMFS